MAQSKPSWNPTGADKPRLDRHLSIHGAEDACGFKRSKIYMLIAEGKFPKPLKIGRSTFWRESDLIRWQQQIAQQNGLEMAGGAGA